MPVTVNIPFDSLLQTIRNLDLSEKQQLWDFLEAELETDDQEEIEVALAYQEDVVKLNSINGTTTSNNDNPP